MGRRSTGYMGADQGRTDMHDYPHSQNPKKVSLALAEVPVSSALLKTIICIVVIIAFPPRCSGLGSSLSIDMPCPTQRKTQQYVSHPALRRLTGFWILAGRSGLLPESGHAHLLLDPV